MSGSAEPRRRLPSGDTVDLLRQHTLGQQRGGAFNPYSFGPTGTVDPKTRTYPMALARAAIPAPTQSIRSFTTSRAYALDVMGLWQQLAHHPRNARVQRLFPVPAASALPALIHDVAHTPIPIGAGATVDSELRRAKLDPEDRLLALQVLGHLHFSYAQRTGLAQTELTIDAHYDEVNWRHAMAEVAFVIDLALKRQLHSGDTCDALIASLCSDAAKLRDNFLVHHVDGAIAAQLILSRVLPVEQPRACARAVGIARAVLEHQVSPPRFMAGQLAQALPASGALTRLQAKVAAPLDARHVVIDPLGYARLQTDDEEAALLQSVGLPCWYVPHPETPWFTITSVVVDADTLVNYATPAGVSKIVAISGPDTPFDDATLFDSIASCGDSLVDALTVMSPEAIEVGQTGIRNTRAAIERVRAVLQAQLAQGGLIVDRDTMRIEYDIDPTLALSSTNVGDRAALIGAPRVAGRIPFWDAPLDYDNGSAASLAFARLLRRQLVTMMRAEAGIATHVDT